MANTDGSGRKRGAVVNPSVDGRRKDYEPRTNFQRWLKAYFDKNQTAGIGPTTYKELYELLIARGVEVTDSHLYKIVRGDPAKYPAVRPGYELAWQIGEIAGDVQGALTASDYPIADTPTITSPDGKTRTVTADGLRFLDAYEGLPEQFREVAQQQIEALHRAANKRYQGRTDIIGKPSDDEEEGGIERVPED